MTKRYKQYLLAEVFFLSFLMLISGIALAHFSDEHAHVKQVEAILLLASFATVFLIAAISCFHYSFEFGLKKSIIFTVLLAAIGLIIASLVGSFITS